MKKAVKQKEPDSHWQWHIFKFTWSYTLNQFVTYRLLDWAKLALERSKVGVSCPTIPGVHQDGKQMALFTQANGHAHMVSYTLT